MKASGTRKSEHETARRGQGAPDIHPTAIVHPDAVLGKHVRVGAYTVIEAGVTIGEGTELMNHVTVHGTTRIGKGNRFYPYCAVGLDPQDKKFAFEGNSVLVIGDNNVFREFVTLNRGAPGGHGTHSGRGTTRVGNGNWILAYCHIAHDCRVGDLTIFSNCATLGGCVTIGDRAYLGGFTAVHPFCSIGELAITGGHTMVAQDVPPFVNATGNRARLYGVNKIGMERAEYGKEEIQNMSRAYKIFFRSKLAAGEALARLEAEFPQSPVVMAFVAFVKSSQRGICR